MDAIGESVPDWQIMTALANGLGCQWEYDSANDVQAEIMKLLPGYYNLGQPKRLPRRPTRICQAAMRPGGLRGIRDRLLTESALYLTDGTTAVSLRQAVPRPRPALSKSDPIPAAYA